MSGVGRPNVRLGDLLMPGDQGQYDAGSHDVPLYDLLMLEGSRSGGPDVAEGLPASLDVGSTDSGANSVAVEVVDPLPDLDLGLDDADAAVGDVAAAGPNLDVAEDLTAGLDFGSAEACAEPEGGVEGGSTLEELAESVDELGRQLEKAVVRMAELDLVAAARWLEGHVARVAPIIRRQRAEAKAATR